jgi:hypothetical protein
MPSGLPGQYINSRSTEQIFYPKFELLINRTAKTLGLSIPDNLLTLADKMIE